MDFIDYVHFKGLFLLIFCVVLSFCEFLQSKCLQLFKIQKKIMLYGYIIWQNLPHQYLPTLQRKLCLQREYIFLSLGDSFVFMLAISYIFYMAKSVYKRRNCLTSLNYNYNFVTFTWK